MKIKKYTLLTLGTVAVASAAFLSSCVKENADSPGWEYFPDMYRGVGPETNAIYVSSATPDSMANRLPAPGSIPRGWTPFPYENTAQGDSLASMFWKSPLTTSDELEEEGKFLYERNCTYCHGAAGDGQGKLVADGKYPNQPPSYTKLWQDGKLSGGHVYHVITYGKGVMGSHAIQLDPEERWKVIMYVERLAQGGEPWSKRHATMTAPKADSLKGDSVNPAADPHAGHGHP